MNKGLYFLFAMSFFFFSTDIEAFVHPIPDPVTDSYPTDINDNDNLKFTGPTFGGTLVIEPNQTFPTGVDGIFNSAANLGIIVLDNNSAISSAIGTIGSSISPLNEITLNGDAGLSSPGDISAHIFNLDTHTLTIFAGDISLHEPENLVINTTIPSDAIFGNIAGPANNLDLLTNGVLVNVNAVGATITGGQSFTIVHASNGSMNNPVTVTSNNPLYSFTGVNFPAGDIVITAFLNNHPIPPPLPPVPGIGEIENDLLTIAMNNPGSDINFVMTAITSLPTSAAMANALLQLNPIVDGSTPWVSFEASQQFQNLWSKHMDNGRCISMAGCHKACYSGKELKGEKKARCEKIKEAGCNTSINCDDVKNRFEIWADGFGYRGSQLGREGFNGYSANIWGGMLGFQAPLSQLWNIGIAGGYAQSKVHRKNNRGKSNIYTYDATGYLSCDATHWYLDGVFSFDYHRYHDFRKIRFPGIDRTAKAHYHGEQYTGLLDMGYRLYAGCTIFTPLASLQYSNLHVHSFHESGAGDLDLGVESQSYNFLESTLGLKITRPVQTRSGAWVPEVHAFWIHDFYVNRMDLDGTTFSGLAAQAGPFDLTGPGVKRDRGDVGAGITFITCTHLSIQLVYNYEFTSNFHANEGLAKLSYLF